VNGATAGSSVANGGTYNLEVNSNWSTDSGGGLATIALPNID